jgi:hypothetical protein
MLLAEIFALNLRPQVKFELHAAARLFPAGGVFFWPRRGSQPHLLGADRAEWRWS